MKQDPSRGGGSTLSPAYSAALEQLAKRRKEQKSGVGDAVLGGLKGALGLAVSPVATVADIAAKPFEAIPGVPDFNPENVGSVNLFVQGGKSLQHVYGDAKELGRSIITGKDTLSQSPSARAYQAAGGGLTGTLAAAGPYLDVGSVVAPMAMGAARGAGLVAPKPVPYTPLTVADLNVARETFGAPTNAYRTTRNALAEDMAQAMTADELRNFAEKVAGSTQQVANLDNGLYGVWGDDPLINDRLRGDYLGTDVDEQIKLAQEFFTRVPPLQRPVKAFRGIMVERPEAGTNAFSDFVRTWEVGDVIEEPGFMSTTIDRNIAEGYANGGRVIEIDIPKGTQVATPEMFGPALRSTEQELTLPPGTKLQITSITDDVIKAKVVPSDTPITKMQTTRDALLRYVDPEVTAPANRPIIEGVRPTAPPQPKRVPTYDEAVAFAQEKMAYDLQREAERALERSVGNTRTGKYYADLFAKQRMDKTVSPTVNWNAVDLAKEQDIQQFLMDPLDEMLLSPEMQTKLAAQRAFRAELLPFLERSGQIVEYFAGLNAAYGGADLSRRSLSQLAESETLGSLFGRLPELKNLYVDTMRSYGIGDVSAPRNK